MITEFTINVCRKERSSIDNRWFCNKSSHEKILAYIKQFEENLSLKPQSMDQTLVQNWVCIIILFCVYVSHVQAE